MNGKTTERRAHPRADADFPLRLGPEGTLPARLKNISRSGLCCVVPEPLPELSMAEAVLEVPSSDDHARTFHLQGAVVRCVPEAGGGYEVALFFQFPPPEAQEVISRYVDSTR